MIKTLTHYKNMAASSTDDKDLTPGVGKTFVIKGISYAVPENGESKAVMYWDGATVSDIQDASYNSKYVAIEGLVFQGDGAKVLKLRLDNGSSGTVAMGLTIYYEENG